MRTDNQSLRLFAGSMATCLAAGLPAQKSLALSGAGTQSKGLRKVVSAAAKGCAQGLLFSEALEPGERVFPRHFLPVVRAGEEAGRLVEAFQLLCDHSRRIAPSVRLVRNTWLYPLVIVVFGWILRAGVIVYFGKYQAAWHFAVGTFGTGLLLGLLGWLLLKIRPVQRTIDRVLLQIPLFRETEIRLAVVLFFATFRLAYAAGGLGVVRMFDLAWQTVRNDAVRADLLKARRVLEQNGTFGDAFNEPALLEDDLKGMINTGAHSGQLDQCLARIVETATQQLDFSLQIFNSFFQRLVAFSVAMSIVETVLMCVLF